MSQRSQTSHAPLSDTSKFQLQSCNRAEDEALFRLTVIGPLLAYDKSQGTKKHLETQIATRVFRRPGHALTTTIAVRTIRRWVAAFNKDGFKGLLPQPRNDRGHGRHFPDWLKSILMDIRQEHPNVSTPPILNHLQRAEEPECRRILAQTSLATLNRFYSEVKLSRSAVRPTTHSGERRKWCAAKPGDVWHADVCHGITLTSHDQANRMPLRIHGILDDASRRVVALSAAKDERELTMIELLIRSVRRFGVPKVLYLDNGSTYRGDMLALVCARLGFRLVHAKAYDPQARGKMERFWRTLREQCLQFIGSAKTHNDVQGDLSRYLEQSYHARPHASLCGQSPNQVWRHANLRTVSEDELAQALEVRRDAVVRNDGSVMHEAMFFQVPKTFLCGKKVSLITSLYDPRRIEIEYDHQRYSLTRVDAVHNGATGRRKIDRHPPSEHAARSVVFDPNASRQATARTQEGTEHHE